MEEKKYFVYNKDDELVASHLGIHKSQWYYETDKRIKENEQYVLQQMRHRNYDVVPVWCEKRKAYCSYYQTITPGTYSSGKIKKIELSRDSIYYLTHIEDTIRLMIDKNHNFIFLNNYSEVIGIITLADFNSRFFYNWLHFKLAELERKLGINLLLTQSVDSIYDKAQELSSLKNDEGKLFRESIGRYQNDSSHNADLSFIEYLYFSQLILLFKEFRLYENMGYNNRGEFENNMSKLKNIRNIVAHPIRSLVKDQESLNNLWKGIEKINELNSKLE